MYMLLEKPDRERGFKKERIIRVLLNHPNGELTKYRISKEAKVSETWCREYTERLEKQNIIKDTKTIAPKKLYEEWIENTIEPNELTLSLQKPMKILKNTNLDYALTTYQAENLKQGLLFPTSTEFYVKPDQTKKWIELAKNKGLIGGGNTKIKATDKHIFYKKQKINNFKLVSTPQLILDLLKEKGPSKEAANKMIQSYHGEE